MCGDDLASLFEGADVVIHLAWLIQPSRDEGLTWRVNVEGSRNVLAACAEAARPPVVVIVSSLAAGLGPRAFLAWVARPERLG